MRRVVAATCGVFVAAGATVAAVVVRSPATIDGHPSFAAGQVSTPSRNASPRAAGLQRVQQAFRTAPLPPGARVGTKALDKYAGEFTTSTSPNELRRTGWWTAPGTIDGTLDFVSRHIPAGMTNQGSGRSTATRSISFATAHTRVAPYGVELDYVFGRYGSAIAVRLDAWTVWVPNRPSWSFVPASATSADVTVVRRAFNRGYGGAPTVHRTLTGAGLSQLAAAVNVLASAPAEGVHSCPAQLIDAGETAVFHTPTGVIRISHRGGGCGFNAQITTAAHHHAAQISAGAFEKAVLAALRLPTDYGYPR
jgi:hypothetical protein